MAEASGSRQALKYVEETEYGVTPADPEFLHFRHNSNTLNLTKDTFQSEELRSDRQIADFRHGARQAGGDVVSEMSAVSFDDMLEAALCGTWDGDVLKAGVVRRSFTLERHFEDIGQYLRYLGMEVNTLQLTGSVGGMVMLTFGFLGRNMETAPSGITGATYPAAPTTPPMDLLSGTVEEGGTEIGVATEISLNLSNGMEVRNVIGGGGLTLRPSIGRSNVTGTMDAYFGNAALYQKFINESASSVEFEMTDGVGGTYTVLLPRIKYTGGTVDVPGEGPVAISMPFQALLDPVAGTNIQITRN